MQFWHLIGDKWSRAFFLLFLAFWSQPCENTRNDPVPQKNCGTGPSKKRAKKNACKSRRKIREKKKLSCVEGPLKHDRGRLLTKPLEAKSGSRGQALEIVRRAKLPGAEPQGQT